MAQARRLTTFSLSFLDVMSCGFGAVVLIFLLLNHASKEEQKVVNKDQLAEIRLLDYQVQEGEKELFELLETTTEINRQLERTDSQVARVESQLESQTEALETLETDAQATLENVNRLRSDLDSRQDEVQKLQALKAAADGTQLRAIEGEGDRQYLTGMKVGGRNIVIVIDTSTSMLDDTLVNVLRRRNMAPERQQQAPKWQRALRTVDWLAAQLPLDAEIQLYAFNEKTASLLGDGAMDWQPMGDGSTLNRGIERLAEEIPSGGTNLEGLILAIRELSPIPDNVYFITDGLPTRGESPPRQATVDGKRRMRLFTEAVSRLPRQIPVNVILFPMEGDFMAGAAWWQLARASGGAFISPSWDWP